MSSLAASRADNFYFPPDWRPEMGGISKFQGSKGANQYQQYGIIRFELPFDAWCLNCKCHMSKGLRFNAKKDRAGKYFTTTIWSFTTKCYDCSQAFVIKTNPQESTYDYVEGLRKHEQEYEPEVEDGAPILTAEETKLLLSVDPMFKLEHVQEGALRDKSAKEQLSDLQSLKEETSKRDYDMNALLRQSNRAKRKREQFLSEEGRRRGLSIPLVEESKAELEVSSSIALKKNKDSFRINEKLRFAAIQQESIFSRMSQGATSKGNGSLGNSNKSAHAKLLLKPKSSKESQKQATEKNTSTNNAMRTLISAKVDIKKFKIT